MSGRPLAHEDPLIRQRRGMQTEQATPHAGRGGVMNIKRSDDDTDREYCEYFPIVYIFFMVISVSLLLTVVLIPSYFHSIWKLGSTRLWKSWKRYRENEEFWNGLFEWHGHRHPDAYPRRPCTSQLQLPAVCASSGRDTRASATHPESRRCGRTFCKGIRCACRARRTCAQSKWSILGSTRGSHRRYSIRRTTGTIQARDDATAPSCNTPRSSSAPPSQRRQRATATLRSTS